MGWLASREAKVVRGGNYPRAKMMLPDAVDRDAGEERILLRCDPAGQGPAAPRARLARTRRLRGVDIARCAKEARDSRPHLFPGLRGQASSEQVMPGRIRPCIHEDRDFLEGVGALLFMLSYRRLDRGPKLLKLLEALGQVVIRNELLFFFQKLLLLLGTLLFRRLQRLLQHGSGRLFKPRGLFQQRFPSQRGREALEA